MSEDKTIEEVQAADKAAAKIQAGFRGYRVRKRMLDQRNAPAKKHHDADDSKELHRLQHHMHGDQVERSNRGTNDEDDESAPEDKSLEDKSATKIQAGVRGFLVRKRAQAEQAAATRIQAGFRGFRTRKLLKQTGQ